MYSKIEINSEINKSQHPSMANNIVDIIETTRIEDSIEE